MISRGPTEDLFILAWAFFAKPDHRRDFERAYGPSGEWVRLFRSGDGYIKTELHRDPAHPSRYITLDFWHSREQYEAFRERTKSAYQEIDVICERLTEQEERLGDFNDVASLHAAFPQLVSETEVGPSGRVRAAAPDDIPEIMLLEQAAPSAAHWTKEAYDAIGRNEGAPRIALVAEGVEDKLCGFVMARIIAEECELENIVVSADELRRGIGSRLLDDLARTARNRGAHRVFLEVRESNSAARALYEKLGFECDGERKGYYSDPVERAILYSLPL